MPSDHETPSSRSRRALLAAVGASTLWPLRAGATSSELSIVVPFPPGSNFFDFAGRLLADALSQRREGPVVVDHRPGASGTLGLSHLARSDAGGRTIGIGSVSTLAVIPAVGSPVIHYDPIASFAPIGMIAKAPVVLAVSNSLGIATFDELVVAARSHPNHYNYVSLGTGISYVAMQLIQLQSRMSLVNIPYSSTGQITTDVVGGRVHVLLDQLAALKPLFAMDSIRALAVLGPSRLASHPNVPTAAELGLQALEFLVWGALLAPVGTSRAIIHELNGQLQSCLESPGITDRFGDIGFTRMLGTEFDCADFIAAELRLWRARASQLESSRGRPETAPSGRPTAS